MRHSGTTTGPATTAERAARRVTVVGGGLAGITAALRCADAGCVVTLLEARPRLGGLTHSFRRALPVDAASRDTEGLWIDNGQHVVLRCCTSYLGLLDRLGVADLVTLQRRLDIPVHAEGRVAHLRRAALPAPLHLAPSLLRYRWLTPTERLAFARAARALRRVDPSSPGADAVSFGDWLRQHGQSDGAVRALWDLVGVAALNARADDTSLALAATVVQQGLLGAADAGDIGWATVPLQRLHGDAAQRALGAVGVRVCLRAKADRVAPDGDGWSVTTPTGVHTSDDVVVAVPPRAAEGLLPPGALALAPGWSAALGASPIVNLHLVVDRRVLDGPFLAGIAPPAPDGTTEYLWVFDRTTHAGLGGTGRQYLAVSLSAAGAVVDEPTAVLRQRFVPQLTALLPRLRPVRLVDFFVTREREATFRPAPGAGRLRPATVTRLPGLVLAGAWTATGWPATMESAVRSGEAAAAAVLAPPLSRATAAERRVVA